MLKKVGKSSDGILEYQKYLISEIESHISEEMLFEMRYLNSTARNICIICETEIGSADFTRNKIQFSFCMKCGHLNGHNQLTKQLMFSTYDGLDSDTIPYDKLYLQDFETFSKAVEKIYAPKSKFLLEALSNEMPASNAKMLKILDFGTGSGHLVAALDAAGFVDVAGIDPMSTTIEHGQTKLGIKGLSKVSIEQSVEHLKETRAKVVTMICTLPHVSNHNEILTSMVENTNILYTFQKLPMYSFGALLDIFNPTVNSRVLSGAHTHLYTNSSLKFLEENFGMTRVAEWRFGADILDLYRNIKVNTLKHNFSSNFSMQFDRAFISVIDKLQYILDESDFSSEIHVLWKFQR